MTDWVLVPNFPDYCVSSEGRILRVLRDLRNHTLTRRFLVPHTNRSGYASVSLCRDAKVFNRRVNRIVCEAFHGPAPTPRHHAAHIDGNRANNKADNLRWASPKENEADKRLHGTAAVGERHWSVLQPEKRAKGSGHGLAKLTEADIPSIRTDPRPARMVASDYGVHKDTINNVRNGRTWRHV